MAATANSPALRAAEAGRRGADVRSDLWFAIEPAKSGGIQMELTSRVASMYADAIRNTTTRTLNALGVQHARVVVEDQGAVPFVIEARVEAAARRAGYAADVPLGDMQAAQAPGAVQAASPDAARAAGTAGGQADAAGEPGEQGSADEGQRSSIVDRPSSSRTRLRRSRLYLPGNEPKFMLNAGLHAPDAVILDLEDSVHPDQKDAARLLVRNALHAVGFGAAELMVRINQLPLGLQDLDAVIPQRPNLILIPKVERAEQVREVAEHIRELQGVEPSGPNSSSSSNSSSTPQGQAHSIWLMPILESALGVENAFDIATADPTVVALTIGLEDYTADLGVVKTSQGDETLYARMRLLNAARAAGLQAIDSVYGDVADEEGLRAWGRRSRAMGFDGMGCVHPRQIRIIHETFAPAPDEIDKALRIVQAWQDAEAKGLGVVSLGSKMIDPPVVLRARRLVDRARAAGLITETGTGADVGQSGEEGA
jgi:citrate lyase subunit beta/citryl-CoA lyase